MYHVIPRMRNENFVNKYGDFGTPQYLWNGLTQSSLLGRRIHHNKHLPTDDK